MRRLEKLLAMLLLGLFTALGAAQADPAQPADPMAPGTELAEPEPQVPDIAWVRLAHFAPNAPELQVDITPTSEDVTYTGDGFQAVEYGGVTEYIEVPAGNYAVSTQGVEGTLEDQFSLARGNYYTLAAMGLVLPAEAQAQEQEEDGEGGGIGGFFRNLFGDGDGNRDRLALQLNLFEDDLTRTPNEGESLIRVIHAAPGTEAVDLAVMGEQGTLIDGVQFGNASNYASYEGSMEELELRLTGSRAATLEVAGENLQQGNLNTLFVIGTPVEEAPLRSLSSSLSPVEAGSPAGEDVALQASQAEVAGGGAAEQTQEDEDAEDAEADQEMDGEPSDGAEGEAEDQAEGEPAEGDGAETETEGQ